MKHSTVLLFCLLFGSNYATGALIERDLVHGASDGLVTVDTLTNLEWLDLTATAATGSSFGGNGAIDDVVANSQPYLSQGFRFALVTEIADLFTHAGLSTNGFTAAQVDSVLSLIGMMGCTSGPQFQGLDACYLNLGPFQGKGLFDFGSGLVSSASFTVTRTNGVPTSAGAQIDSLALSGIFNQAVGAFLVRSGSVPIPASALNMVVALFLMLIARNRRSNHFRRRLRS